MEMDKGRRHRERRSFPPKERRYLVTVRPPWMCRNLRSIGLLLRGAAVLSPSSVPPKALAGQGKVAHNRKYCHINPTCLCGASPSLRTGQFEAETAQLFQYGVFMEPCAGLPERTHKAPTLRPFMDKWPMWMKCPQPL